MHPEEFWSPLEEVVGSFHELQEVLGDVFAKGPQKGRVFAWRGHADAEWALNSSLYRRLKWTVGKNPLERDLYKREGDILAEIHRWGLHMKSGIGRLSVLNQLATIQHYGAPTRLLDVSFNSWIGVWFAVEEKYSNGNPVLEEADGRVFAVDVTDSLINESDTYRTWEDDVRRPWRIGHPGSAPKSGWSTDERGQYLEWCTSVVAWRPPHFDGRIAAQNGGFIMGGVPLSGGPGGKPNQWQKQEGGYWRIDEVREATSLSLHPNKLGARKGRVSGSAVYSIRIKAHAKAEIRSRLQAVFGYEHRTLFPDFSGFADFATPRLKDTYDR